MKIAYFSNQFATRSGHGIARYARHLFDSMNQLETGHKIQPVAAWSDREPGDLENLQSSTGLKLIPWGRRWTPLAWTYLGWPKIERWIKNIDVVHAVSLGYPVATNRSFVVTVHDIGPLTHPEYFSAAPPWIMQKALRQAIRQAKTFICVSQATATELIDYVKKNYGTNVTDRVEVILEGVEERFFENPNSKCLESLALPDAPFLMTAGAMSPRKNIGGVIKALGKLKDKIPHHLVAVGGSGWDTDEITDPVKESGIQDRIHFLGYVSDEQLFALYHRAAMYLHPSLFEGFGLTVLEAMAAGCPVITSNVFSLPEVAGDAALLVDPVNVSKIAEAIESLATDDRLSESLQSKGKDRAKKFQWSDAARKVVATYEKAAGL